MHGGGSTKRRRRKTPTRLERRPLLISAGTSSNAKTILESDDVANLCHKLINLDHHADTFWHRGSFRHQIANTKLKDALHRLCRHAGTCWCRRMLTKR